MLHHWLSRSSRDVSKVYLPSFLIPVAARNETSGYQLITDAKNMPAEFQYLRVRLKTEQYRLLDWAHVVQLDEQDDHLLISNASKGLLLDVLDQQNKLLQQFGRVDEKYKRLRRPLLTDIENHTGERLSNMWSKPSGWTRGLGRSRGSFAVGVLDGISRIY